MMNYNITRHSIDLIMSNLTKDLLSRITVNKEILAGKPIVRGMRISVAMILELLAKGATTQEILEDYPELENADIQAVLLYAHHLVENEDIFERVAVS
jgi:uncharacterized protein (DUF433 family)